MTIDPIEYVVIAGYFLLMVVIGLVFKGFSSNVSDYIRAGAKGTWWLVGMSVFMSMFSALTFTGISGQAYIAGWSILIIFWCNALGFFLQAAVFAPWFRQTRAITPGDVIRMRFGEATEQYFVYISSIGALLWGGSMLLGLATFVSAIFSIHIVWVILFVGVVVGFYSVSGGNWSVMATDYIQSLILLSVTIAVAVLCLLKIGGIDGLFQSISDMGLEKDFALIKPEGYKYSTDLPIAEGRFTMTWTAAMVIYALIQAVNPGSSYRYLSVKDGASARKAAILAGVLMLLGSMVWFIAPMVGRFLYADQIESIQGINNVADAAYAVVSQNVLPNGVLGLVVVAMFAATMSTMDGALTGTAGHIVNNLLPPLRRLLGRKTPNDKAQLSLVRRVNMILAVVVIGLALALNYGVDKKLGLFGIMQNIMALLGGPIAVPLAASMLIRRAPKWSALVSISAGFIAGLVCLILGQNDVTIVWQMKLLIVSGSSLLGFLASLPFGRNLTVDYSNQVNEFFNKMHRPVVFEDEVGESNDRYQLRLLGIIAVVVGVLISALALRSSSMHDVVTVLAIAGGITLVGGIMVLLGKNNPATDTD